jgi:outer membrane receptor protein involved in Fe transport
VWQLDIDSELLFVGDAGETEPSRASRRYGVEWNNHYVVNDWLLLDMDVALSKARFSDYDPTFAGNSIPGSINKVASLGATVTNWGNWFGSMQLRYFGPRALIEDNSVRSKSTMLTYARVGYRYNPRTTLTLDVFNLFDRKASDIDYFYESQLAGEPAAVNDIHFHPVEPRTARLTMTYNF